MLHGRDSTHLPVRPGDPGGTGRPIVATARLIKDVPMPTAVSAASLIAAAVVLQAACSAQPAGDEQSSQQADIARRMEARERLAKPLPAREPEATPAAVTGEVPAELLTRIIADLASRIGADTAAFEIVRGEAVTWNDGSLGCPRPGVAYTQALVPGYWVVLSHEGLEYDYRASARGYFLLCEAGGLPPSPGDPDLR
jgi:hypothetical protein